MVLRHTTHKIWKCLDAVKLKFQWDSGTTRSSEADIIHKRNGQYTYSIYLADWHEKWQIALLIIYMRACLHDVLHIIALIRGVAHGKTKLNKITRKHHNIRQVCYMKQISVFEFLEIIESLTFWFDWLVWNCVITMNW